MEIKEIVEILSKAKDAYYNGRDSGMTDREVDQLEDKLRELDSKNPYFVRVGAQSYGNKSKHEIPMKSLQKANSQEQIFTWAQKCPVTGYVMPYVVLPKIDGVSGTARYNNGKLQVVATRGNGYEGQDVTENAKYIKDIPKQISYPGDIEIRFEFYLPRDTKFHTNGKPLRNIASGLISSKYNLERCRYLRILAYNVIGIPASTEMSKLIFLENIGFPTPHRDTCEYHGLEKIYQRYITFDRDMINYEIDGLVIILNSVGDQMKLENKDEHHNDFNIAWKFPNESKTTILQKIDWNMSRHGNLIPVAVFEPVIMGGTKISRATLNNLSNVKELNLRIGCEIMVEKANDVIPYIAGSSVSADLMVAGDDMILNFCPYCKTPLVEKGVHLKCTNKECEEQQIQRMIHWIGQCEMDGVSESTVKLLYNNGITNILKLYTLLDDIQKQQELVQIDGFGFRKLDNLLNQIKNSDEMNIQELVSRLGIPLVGIKALKKLKINSVKEFIAFNDPTYVIGQNIIEWFSDDANKTLLSELLSVIRVNSVAESVNTKKVAMTGKGPKGRKELVKNIEAKGHEFTGTINKETDILLCEDINGSSSKLQKARQLGIEIRNYNEYF